MAEQQQLAIVALETLNTAFVHRAVQRILKVDVFVASEKKFSGGYARVATG